MKSDVILNIIYIISALLFLFGVKMLSSPETARKGNLISSSGMLIAILSTLVFYEIIKFEWIIVGIILGTAIGVSSARLVTMTAIPQMVALFNGFGGLASLIVGWCAYINNPSLDTLSAVTVVLSILIGGVAFSGSMVAWAKLSGTIKAHPVRYKGQKISNLILLFILFFQFTVFISNPAENYPLLIASVVLSFVLGVMAVIPIGGADMPVVISLLNSYSGLAVCAVGFVILNNLLIITGALIGASGIILTNIMCKAMNRSIINVLFGGLGTQKVSKDAYDVSGSVNSISIRDTYLLLEAASTVVITPGYGMAVAQAQYVVSELAALLKSNGSDVKYAIHPVAGRMPGHMNVLLAEANVSYDDLIEMENINAIMESVDVCIVIGANDVVNPSAREQKDSPIYGMPIIDADRAKTVIVLKRSMATGFSGVPNPLFYKENTRMLFGDAKVTIQGLIAEFNE